MSETRLRVTFEIPESVAEEIAELLREDYCMAVSRVDEILREDEPLTTDVELVEIY